MSTSGALARIRNGSSARADIHERGCLMISLLNAGDISRAERVAVEIEDLQRADALRLNCQPCDASWPVGLGLADWARIITRGAWKVPRRVHPASMPSTALAAE